MKRQKKADVQKTYQEQIKELFEKTEYCIEKPEHIFSIGEQVQMGNIAYVEIVDVINDGEHYVIYMCSKTDHVSRPKVNEELKIVPWYSLHKISKKEESLIENQDIASLISFESRFLDGFIDLYFLGFLNLEPEYQRDFVWTLEDKENLITSMFKCVDIGKFVFVENKDHTFEVLDGKQRLKTFIDFRLGKFTYKGRKFEELSMQDKNHLKKYKISVATVRNMSLKKKLEYYLYMNTNGKIHTQEELNIVKKMIEKM